MKLILIVMICGILTYSCSDSDCEEDTFSLVGEWQLYEFCTSIGAQCIMRKPEFEQSLEFFSDGTFRFNGPSASCSGSYSMQENAITFSNQSDSTCLRAQLNLRIFDNCSISINPNCFEACIYKYRRA